jgi:predicted choloylglycine hydrolase
MFTSFKKILAPLMLLPFIVSCDNQQNTKSIESGEIYFEETVVAGGPDDFMEVRHVILKGSNYAIGKKIAEIAQRDNVHVHPFGDPLRNKIQHEYMAKNYPILYQRMKGVAQAYGLDVKDDAYDLSGLSQNPIGSSGCSVVFFPGTFTESGHGILSRNYDFTTGTAQGKRPSKNDLALMSRPYIFEMYPDQGYSSLSLCAFDLLGGVLDGINSEGLVVAVLGDDETAVNYGMHPSAEIGMHELLSMRYLLDNCRDVKEAKEAMLHLKHYYTFVPCHYIIADKTGRSFVFEFSPLRNSTHIVDGVGPQCVTNHLLSNYESIDQLPEDERIDSYDRFRKIHASIADEEQFSADEIRAINSSVANTGIKFDHPDYAPNRTLWHALYDIEQTSMSVKFYLGERADPTDEKIKTIEYSDYLDFRLTDND